MVLYINKMLFKQRKKKVFWRTVRWKVFKVTKNLFLEPLFLRVFTEKLQFVMNKSLTNALSLLAKPLAEDSSPKNGWQIKTCNSKLKKGALND